MNVVLLGAPGAGKGTQAEKICSLMHYEHISTGDILRKAVKDKNALGQQAEGFMNKGELVPDDLMIQLIKQVLPDSGGFLLDGFPRTLEQAKALDLMLDREGKSISVAVNIRVGTEELMNRMIKRNRSDDNPQTISNRLKVYESQTKPVIDYYEQQRKLKEIDGEKQIDEITRTIMGLLN